MHKKGHKGDQTLQDTTKQVRDAADAESHKHTHWKTVQQGIRSVESARKKITLQ